MKKLWLCSLNLCLVVLLLACGNKGASSEGSTTESNVPSGTERISSGKDEKPVIEVTYKLDGQEFKPEITSMSVNFNTESVKNENGVEKKNSSLKFTVYGENGIAFRFHVREDKVVERFSGRFPVREISGFTEGESIRSVAIMMVNTKTGQSKISQRGSTCEVDFSGNNLKLNLKGVSFRLHGDEAPVSFEMSLNARNVRVERS